MVHYIFPSVESELKLERQCPHCHRFGGNRHSGIHHRTISDNQLLQHIERTWRRVSRDPVDATNNTTERIIGLTHKIRAKTMRGFKSPDKVLSHPYLAEFIRGNEGICDFRQFI